jgi:hypothetical protein
MKMRLHTTLFAGSATLAFLVAVAVSGAPASAAAAPPTATTNAASNITGTTATLNGVAGPPVVTSYHFQWGTTTSYGNTTPTGTVGCPPGNSNPQYCTGVTTAPVSANITGLTPGTTYHFRLVATNTNGTTNGADNTFLADCPDPTGAYNGGFNTGFNSGFNPGFNSGFGSGYDAGYRRGFHLGFMARARSVPRQALPAGCSAPFNQGFNTAFNTGFNVAFNPGFNPGYDAGFNQGFNAGFKARHP